MLPVDSAWLALEKADNPAAITVMMRIEGLTTDRLRAFLENYWLAWERFRCMPVSRHGGWWWETDPVFSLHHHLAVVKEPLTPDQLQAWVSARLNQPLPDYRPRWKFWLAPRAEGGAALLLRIHHCYADGRALMAVFNTLCTRSPQQAPVIYGCREALDVQRWVSTATGLLKQAVLPLAGAVGDRGVTGRVSQLNGDPDQRGPFARAAYQSLKVSHEITGFLTAPEDTAASLKRPLLGRRHCRWSEPLPLTAVQAAARGYGCTLNDILLACVSRALHQHLVHEGSDPDAAIAHAAVPVDIRERLPDTLKPEQQALGNYFGTVFVPLPVDARSALERLFRTKHETRKLRQSWQPAVAWGVTSAAPLLPESWRRPLADILSRRASAVVSNVAGTREPRYLAGCRIREQVCWVPQAGSLGLGVSVVSYAGQLQLGVVADEAILDDPDTFLATCLQELAELVPASDAEG